MKPGVHLYVSAGGRTHLQELEALVHPFLPEANFGGDPNQFGLENGEHCLLTTFEIVEIDHYDNELIFCQPKPLIAYVTSEPAVKQALVGPKLEAFRQFIAETLIDRHEIRVTTEKGLFRSIKGSA